METDAPANNSVTANATASAASTTASTIAGQCWQPYLRRILEAGAAPVPDPAFTPFVTASIEEIRHAQRLRKRIEERYLNWPTPPVTFWSVGAD